MSEARSPVRKLKIAQRAIETARLVLAVLQRSMMGATIAVLMLGAMPCSAQQLTNGTLSVAVNRQDGSYEFGPH